jgi:hypothetical protein
MSTNNQEKTYKNKKTQIILIATPKSNKYQNYQTRILKQSS